MNSEEKYTFSGHESFFCKALWLKKGYDFVSSGKDFNNPYSVVDLGVGKNMVSSIRFWMKAFGICDEEGTLSKLGDYLFNDESGRDKYLEDIATLWLLHYNIVSGKVATLYNLFFCEFQKEHIIFTKDQLLKFVSTRFSGIENRRMVNNATLEKDINVLLLNYAPPRKSKSNEDYSALLLDLDIIKQDVEGKGYFFNIESKCRVPIEIFMYVLVNSKTDDTISYEDIKDSMGLPFCMSDGELISMLKHISKKYSKYITYNDNSGIRQVQFINQPVAEQFLEEYYEQI